MTTGQDVASYLAQFPNVQTIRPCVVTIRGTQFQGAHYTQECELDSSTAAYRNGAPRRYTREMFYLVGMLPAVRRNGNVAFRIEGDAREWFVASYYGKVTGRAQDVAEPNQFHPFGNSFQLAPWDVADSTVDHYERVPYRRVPLTITYS